MYNLHMENEDNLIYKKWFSAKPFMDKFLPNGWDKYEALRLANSLGIQRNRLQEMMRPDYAISEKTADAYAIRLRVPPIQHMA